jgi:FtsH-binding integral membrane protein
MSLEGDAAVKFGIFGALKLYLDFINMFLFILRLFGRRR